MHSGKFNNFTVYLSFKFIFLVNSVPLNINLLTEYKGRYLPVQKFILHFKWIFIVQFKILSNILINKISFRLYSIQYNKNCS